MMYLSAASGPLRGLGWDRVLGQIQQPASLVVRREWGVPLAAKPNFASLLRCRWPPDTSFQPDQVGPHRYVIDLVAM